MLTYDHRLRLVRLYDPNGADYKAIERLVNARGHASLFRRSLAKQALDWLNDPHPKRRYPLSAKQMSYIRRPSY